MASEHEQLAFGDYVLDATRRELRRCGTPVPLTPRLYNALYLFASRPGELLDKRALIGALWPGLVVEENNLSQLVSALRRALGDDEAQLIRTEPRRGFRFIADVTALHVAPKSLPTRLPAKAHTSLAVLPFVALAADAASPLLAMGMADSLIARLSTLPALVVRSFGSVRRFAHGERDAAQAGRDLSVDWIVDGTLRHEGGRLRASARLLSVAEGTAAWSDRFDVAWTSVFDVQDTISERVARALGRQLAHAQGGTRDVDAYQLYLAGLNHAQGIRADGLDRSVELFRHALAIDPRYALAHAGISESFRRMMFGADRTPTEIFAQMRTHVTRALELSPSMPEAHAQLGWLRYWCDHDWAGAERAFRHALALNPNLAYASFGLGFMLGVIGRCDECMMLLRAARELDPMSLLICTIEATFLLRLGDIAASGARLTRVIEVAPLFWVAHLAKSVWHEAQGEVDAAHAAAERAFELSDQSSQAEAMLGALLARQCRRDEARAVLARMEARSQERYVPPTSLASVQAALGDSAAALASLESAFDCRDARLIYLRSDARWETLREEPRFRALVERMNQAGLPPGLAPP
jgi:TolB-like protein/tetratricopeptide (TPR) repeat protein